MKTATYKDMHIKTSEGTRLPSYVSIDGMMRETGLGRKTVVKLAKESNSLLILGHRLYRIQSNKFMTYLDELPMRQAADGYSAAAPRQTGGTDPDTAERR